MAMNLLPATARPSTHPFAGTPAPAPRHPRLHALQRQPGSHRNGATHHRAPLEVAAPCLSETLVAFTPAGGVKRQTLIAHGMSAEVVHGIAHDRIESYIRSPHHMLIAYERGSRRDGETFVEDLPHSTVRDLARKLVFVPAGHEYQDWQSPRVNMSAIYFYFDPATLADRAGPESGSTSLRPRLFFDNPMLWDTALKMKAVVENSSSENQAYFEALGYVLAHEIARLGSGAPTSQPPGRGGLAAWQQRTAAAYIEEHLAESISLSTLAQLVRLSPYYFCRTFKQSFGVPPHRYHSNRRIERAKELLMERKQSVTDVAQAMGFGETSSFSAAFRKTTGLTPTKYQRSIG